MKTKLRTVAAYIAATLFLGVPAAVADSMLSILPPPAPILSGNVAVTSSGVIGVNLDSFYISSSGGTSNMQSMLFRVPPGAVRPERLTLFRVTGFGQIVMSAGSLAADGTMNFTITGQQQLINEGEDASFLVRVNFGSGIAPMSYSRLQLVSISYKRASGASATLMPTPARFSQPQWLMPVAANWSLDPVRPPVVEKTIDSVGNTLLMATLTLQMDVKGASGVNIPNPEDYAVDAKVGRDYVPCTIQSVEPIPSGMSSVLDGKFGKVQMIAILPTDKLLAASFQSTGEVVFQLRQINWSTTGANPTKISQTWGLERLNSTSANIDWVQTSATRATTGALTKISATLWKEIETLSQPDANGFCPQLGSEGFAVLVNSAGPTKWNEFRRIVFPISKENGNGSWTTVGQMMQVNADVTTSDITPHILAPSNPLEDSRTNLVEYPLTNVVKNDGRPDSRVDKVTFQVAFGGSSVSGIAIRTGESSAMLQFYWGSDSSYDGPGKTLDMLDLSGSYAPLPPATGSGYPQRFALKVNGVSFDPAANTLTQNADALFDAVHMEATTDLKTWYVVPCALSRVQQSAIDTGCKNADMVLDLNSPNLPQALKGAPKVLIRAATNG